MRGVSILFPCGDLTLEGTCYYPDGEKVSPAVVICHPHPMYGGSMNNNIIGALSSALIDKSIIAFMFNFRGVGRSEGKFGGGIAEQEDVVAAMSWLASQPEVDADKTGLTGYSFGATVIAPVACDIEQLKAIAFISPPFELPLISQLKECPKSKLIICGTEDEFIPIRNMKLLNGELAEPKQFELVPGADHFWAGYENTVAETIAAFFSNVFKREL